jgi:PKD repeat protein
LNPKGVSLRFEKNCNMKKTFLIALVTFFHFNFSSTFSQEVVDRKTGNDWCANDRLVERLKTEDPEQYARYLESQEKFRELLKNNAPSAPRLGAVTTIIPVVIHVIHQNGSGNISTAQVLDGLRVMNEDYQRNNSDTNSTRSVFKPFAGGMDVEFRLARKDPQGNCTDGIIRINSTITSVASSNDPIKSLSYWPSNKYYNIWITRSISGGGGGGIILGYAPFPGLYNWNQHGLTIIHPEWGTIGTANGGLGRTAPHEAGHNFNLYHTFQSNCGSNCSSSGDLVCDTPPSANPSFGCNQSQNTCSNDANGPSPYTSNVVDQIENYMSYDFCQNMFSQGQINRMQSAMTGVPQLANLASISNNIASGTDDAYWFTAPLCAPIAEFKFNKSLVCGGGNVTFTDESFNAPQDASWSWSWAFPGATPSSSNLQNPVITYNNPGIFGVTLTTTNSAGSSVPKTKTGIITVLPGDGPLSTGIEDFSNPQFPNNILEPDKSWVITQAPSNVIKWERSTAAFYSSPSSVWLNQFFANSGNENYLTTPGYDLSAYSDSIFLRYKLAHAPSSQAGLDQLRIMISTDCGVTWSQKEVMFSAFIYSNGGVSADNFVPSGPGEWITKENDLSSLAGLSNVQIRFQARSGNHNNFWIDDVTIYQGTISGLKKITDVEFLGLYPNPAVKQVNIQYELLKDSEVTLSLIDRIGRERILAKESGVAGSNTLSLDISAESLSPGIYMLRIETSQGSSIQKLVIQ